MCEVTKYLMFARELFGNKNGKNSNQINYKFHKLSIINMHRKMQLTIFNNSWEYKYGPLYYKHLNLFSAVAKLMIDAKVLVKTSEEL